MKAMDVYVRNRYQSAAAFKAAIESTIPEITKAEPGPQSDKKKPKADRKTAIIAGVITGVITGLLASFILIYVFSSKDDPIQTEPQDTSVLIGPPQDTAALIRPPENTPATQNTSVSTRPQENKPAQQNTPVSTKPPANKPTVQNTAVLTKPPENKPATQDTLPQDTASLTKPPENKPEPQDKFVSIDIPLVYVSGGTFTMGCTAEQGKDCTKNEKPEHEVTVDGFYIGKYEVTQAQWKAVTGSNPSKFKGDNLPVVVVSWDDIVGTSGDYMTINSIKYYANGFIYKLNKLTGKQYRLPTEAEWEYAARGGADSQGYKYSGSNTLSNVAWYEDNSDHKTHPVGTKSANELGIYDMSGNVCEWCSDWYGKYSYSYNSQTNPTGPATGSRRVIRGGGLAHKGRSCRVSNREYLSPGFRVNYLGFRLACSSNEIITKTFFI
jgi:formylglycine-generating enzyme required for sulfatase activity